LDPSTTVWSIRPTTVGAAEAELKGGWPWPTSAVRPRPWPCMGAMIHYRPTIRTFDRFKMIAPRESSMSASERLRINDLIVTTPPSVTKPQSSGCPHNADPLPLRGTSPAKMGTDSAEAGAHHIRPSPRMVMLARGGMPFSLLGDRLVPRICVITMARGALFALRTVISLGGPSDSPQASCVLDLRIACL
jgi:hypothetical protein